jgi:hypothetical protein
LGIKSLEKGEKTAMGKLKWKAMTRLDNFVM